MNSSKNFVLRLILGEELVLLPEDLNSCSQDAEDHAGNDNGDGFIPYVLGIGQDGGAENEGCELTQGHPENWAAIMPYEVSEPAELEELNSVMVAALEDIETNWVLEKVAVCVTNTMISCTPWR